MGSYRYLFADTITGVIFDELPMTVDSFGNDLGDGGTFTGTLPLGGLTDRAWYTVTTPGKVTIHAVRDDNQVVWSGPIVGREPAGTDKATLRAETLEAWLKRRKFKTDIVYNSDVFSIIRDILDTIQGHLGGDLGLQVASGLAGWTQSVTYTYEQRAVVWDEIQRLLQTGNGGEAWISTSRDPTSGTFVPLLNLGTPQINAGLPPIVLEYPGNVLSYTYPEAVVANAVAGLGKGDGASKLIYEAIDVAGQIAAGYPLVDADYSAGEEDDLPRLTSRTKIDLAVRLADKAIPQVVINGDQPGLEFGSFPLGIPARLRATSLFHPAGTLGQPGLDVGLRVVGWSVKPPSDGGIEEVTLTLASGLGKIRPPMDEKAFRRWLRNLERRVSVFETRR